MMEGLRGTTAVLFGGAGGIGSATSRRLAAEGVNVVVASRTEANAEKVAAQVREADGHAVATAVDIGDETSVAAVVALAVETYGGIDAVHVNAADMRMEIITNDTDAVGIDLDVFDQTVRTNLRGYLVCTQATVPALLERGGGSIVYTSSAAVWAGEPERPAYAMTKGGLGPLVRHVASRWGREGIRANAIAPGPTVGADMDAMLPAEYKQQMLATLRHRRLGRPEDIAAMVAFLISDEGEWINGQEIRVDGGRII
jgi:NAD(P)-dependent dehydrogenase (short-subunit alcohol dehydrogenase family)